MKKFKLIINPEKLNLSKEIFNTEKNVTLDVIIKNPDEEIPKIKNILNKNGVIVIGFENYNEDINNFGYILFKISFPNSDIPIVGVLPKLYFTSIENAFLFFKDLKANILFLNNNLSPLSPGQIKNILTKLEKQIKQQQTPTKKDHQAIKKNDREKLIEFIDEIIKDTDNIIKKTMTVFPSKTKQLKKMIDELSKIKRSSNIEKINFLLEQIISESEKLELDFIQKEKLSQHIQTTQDSLSDLEIILEHEKLKKSKKLIKLKNINKNWKEQFYGYLGKFAVSITLVIKDFNKKLKFIDKYLIHIKSMFKLIIILSIILLTISALYFKFYSNTSNFVQIIHNLILLGSIGSFILIGILFIKKFIQFIYIIPISILIGTLFYYSIKLLFAL